ncbi:MAG: YtxH domain-containing protein [Flavobacteriales bacterium]|nr:YtxH domain-containing protein [Flavobacteriales bacterium]
MNKKGAIGLTVAALATGAALGILFAPASGRKTRKRIARRGRDAREKLNELLEEGKALFGKMRQEADESAERAKTALRNGANETAKAAREAAAAARS